MASPSSVSRPRNCFAVGSVGNLSRGAQSAAKLSNWGPADSNPTGREAFRADDLHGWSIGQTSSASHAHGCDGGHAHWAVSPSQWKHVESDAALHGRNYERGSEAEELTPTTSEGSPMSTSTKLSCRSSNARNIHGDDPCDGFQHLTSASPSLTDDTKRREQCEFAVRLRQLRGSVLRAWRLDLNPSGTGRVPFSDLIRVGRTLNLSTEARRCWDELRGDGNVGNAVSISSWFSNGRASVASSSAPALRFRELAPDEAENLDAFVNALKWTSGCSKLSGVWNMFLPHNQTVIGFADFQKGAERVGFSGDVKTLFRGLDSGGLGRVLRSDLENLTDTYSKLLQTAPSSASSSPMSPSSPASSSSPQRRRGARTLGNREDAADMTRKGPAWDSQLQNIAEENRCKHSGMRQYFTDLRPIVSQDRCEHFGGQEGQPERQLQKKERCADRQSHSACDRVRPGELDESLQEPVVFAGSTDAFESEVAGQAARTLPESCVDLPCQQTRCTNNGGEATSIDAFASSTCADRPTDAAGAARQMEIGVQVNGFGGVGHKAHARMRRTLERTVEYVFATHVGLHSAEIQAVASDDASRATVRFRVPLTRLDAAESALRNTTALSRTLGARISQVVGCKISARTSAVKRICDKQVASRADGTGVLCAVDASSESLCSDGADDYPEDRRTAPEAELDGTWTTGDATVTISGCVVAWPNGFRLELSKLPQSGRYKMVVQGVDYYAQFGDSNRILWDDGDAWIRQAADSSHDIGSASGPYHQSDEQHSSITAHERDERAESAHMQFAEDDHAVSGQPPPNDDGDASAIATRTDGGQRAMSTAGGGVRSAEKNGVSNGHAPWTVSCANSRARSADVEGCAGGRRSSHAGMSVIRARSNDIVSVADRRSRCVRVAASPKKSHADTDAGVSADRHSEKERRSPCPRNQTLQRKSNILAGCARDADVILRDRGSPGRDRRSRNGIRPQSPSKSKNGCAGTYVSYIPLTEARGKASNPRATLPTSATATESMSSTAARDTLMWMVDRGADGKVSPRVAVRVSRTVGSNAKIIEDDVIQDAVGQPDGFVLQAFGSNSNILIIDTE